MALTEDAILRRIRALMERADHPETPQHEKDACREKADKMMHDHAVEQAELDMTRPAADRAKPEKLEIAICMGGNPVWQSLVDLFNNVALHCRCRAAYTGLGAKGRWGITGNIVGYPADLRYFQMLYTSLVLQMGNELEPKPDPAKSLAENVYILHNAGVKWRRIAELLNKAWDEMPTGLDLANHAGARWRKEVRPSKDQPGVLIPWPDGHRLINLYRKHCRAVGELPRTVQSPITYQRNFAESYATRVSIRLYEMRKGSGAGTALELRADSVDEAYGEFFPGIGDRKPPKRAEYRYEWSARDAGRDAANRADLGGNRVSKTERPQLS